ncbi:hypothetical protein AB5N19_04522 [Seiridium cardinale]
MESFEDALNAMKSSSDGLSKNQLELIPNEIKQNIFIALGDMKSAHNLSLCSRNLHAAYKQNQGLVIYHLLEAELGSDILRLASARLAASKAD